MSKRSDQDWLSDIQEAIRRIEKYCENLTYSQFAIDSKTQDAVLRNLGIMGEAVKNLSKKFKSSHSDIPWSDIAKLRDKLIHHYFGVNIDIIWDVIESYLPEVSKKLHKIN